MHPLSKAAEEAYFNELDSLSSGSVTYSCSGFPASVLAGLGLRPVRIPVSLHNTGSLSVREDICPRIPMLLSSMETVRPAAVTGTYTCDMTRRFYQESSRLTGAPVHQLQLPSVSGEASEVFFARQVERVCRDLVRSGLSDGYSPERAEVWYRNTMEGMSFLGESSLSLPPVALQYFFHLFRICDPALALGMIRRLVREHPGYHPAMVLLRSGSPALPGDHALELAVERENGCLVPVNCSGTLMAPGNMPDDWTPGALAALHLRWHLCIRRRPNGPSFDHLLQACRSFRARGVIVSCLDFCDLWYTEKVRLKEILPLPVLIMDSGASPGERERIIMRVETFIHTLEPR